MEFKFFTGIPYNPYDEVYRDIPEDHYVYNISPDMYEPYNFNLIRVVYYKHSDPTIEGEYKMVINEGHPLWNWPDVL